MKTIKHVFCNISIFFPQEYFKLRTRAIEKLKASDCHPYPHKFHVELSLEKFIEKYEDTQPGTVLEKTVVSVAGKSKCIFF